MADAPKQPLISKFMPVAFTGMASGLGGDQVADAISDIIVWKIGISCTCIPPDAVVKATHTLCIAVVMIAAFAIHYSYLKIKGDAE